MNSNTAVVYCENAFDTTYGKTAHGLVRFTERYRIAYVIDSHLAGKDAGMVLDRKESGILIVRDLNEALERAERENIIITHFIVGIATDGGFLTDDIKKSSMEALNSGLNIDSGLHEYISDIPRAQETAAEKGLAINDIRKERPGKKHAFTGKIREVTSCRIAVLGTDSAIGKRTTAWIITHALRNSGSRAELIGTGQTAWLQGAKYGIILDSLINDYISGELEHALWTAWRETGMEYAIIEGQGSLMNPGYPGGFEILAAGRPHGIIMQHAPFRKEYDGFEGYPMDPLNDQIHIAEFLSKRPVIAVTLNHEGVPAGEIDRVCRDLENSCGRPVVDPLVHGADRLLPLIRELKNDN